MEKPFAPACERNKDVILALLKEILAECRAVLEIGSGTGQHAVVFAAGMPHLHWHTSDRSMYLEGIRAWVADSGLVNISHPLELDAGEPWQVPVVDAFFTANTLHIMSWPLCQQLIGKVGANLPSGGRFCAYGPFNYGGAYSSESNAQFDIWLKQRDELSAIRHFEHVVAEAEAAGLRLIDDHAMPANNRLLHFQKD